jgi:hypothetical protein
MDGSTPLFKRSLNKVQYLGIPLFLLFPFLIQKKHMILSISKVPQQSSKLAVNVLGKVDY